MPNTSSLSSPPPEKEHQNPHSVSAHKWQYVLSESGYKIKGFAETCCMVTRHSQESKLKIRVQALSDGLVKEQLTLSVSTVNTSGKKKKKIKAWEAKKHILKDMGH